MGRHCASVSQLHVCYKGLLLAQDSDRVSSDSVRNSAVVTPETARVHGSIDMLIVFRTVEASWPTRKATPTMITATGSNSGIIRQHETAAALRAPVQYPVTTASEAGKGRP